MLRHQCRILWGILMAGRNESDDSISTQPRLLAGLSIPNDHLLTWCHVSPRKMSVRALDQCYSGVALRTVLYCVSEPGNREALTTKGLSQTGIFRNALDVELPSSLRVCDGTSSTSIAGMLQAFILLGMGVGIHRADAAADVVPDLAVLVLSVLVINRRQRRPPPAAEGELLLHSGRLYGLFIRKLFLLPGPSTSRMTASPGLNWDVLRVVAFWADRSTCATLMLSCRFFYHEAITAILSRPIYLRNDHQAAAFLLFVRIDSGSRLRYVRDLSLGFCQELTASTLDSLVQSMSVMTGLERLKLRDGEEFLQRYSALADVIGR